jgi:elongation factor Ts
MENIKILRDKTGAGIVDCKKALEESGGDIDLAAEILRKKGIAKASKRSARDAQEGIIKVALNSAETAGYIFELNSETDFVSRNEKFLTLAEQIMSAAKIENPNSMQELLVLEIGGHSIEDNVATLGGVIGEKISLKRYDTIDKGGTIAAYTHPGARVGVLVALDQTDQKDLAKEIALQIAASSPRYITRNDVSAEEIEKEKNIYREQLIQEGKPEAMLEKIILGKLDKFYEGICLLDQEYIKDDGKKISDILGSVKVIGFIRYGL